MSFTDFKEVITNNPGTTIRFGSNDLKEVMQIFNGKVVANRRPKILSEWVWLSHFDIKPSGSIPVSPTEADSSRIYADPIDFKIKIKKTGGTIIDIENMDITNSSLQQITDKGKLHDAIFYKDVDNDLGDHFFDMGDIAAPSNPADGIRRLFVNSVTGELSVRTSAGTSVSLETQTGGGGGDVFLNQANTHGDFDNIFRSSRLIVRNPANTFSYLLTGSAIAANRTVTLPLLTANDTAVTEAFTQTLTNKTINTDQNTIKDSTTNATGDLLKGNGTKFVRFAKGTASQYLTVNAGGTDLVWATPAGGGNVSTTASNTYGDFDQIFRSGRLDVTNPANTFNYSITGSAIIAARAVTLPLLTADDTFVTAAFAQTLTNKTIAAGSNTISGIVDTHIATHTTTKISTLSKSLLNTAIVYNDQNNNLGDFYLDIGDIAAPANPATGVLRLFNNTTTGELSVRKSGGTTVSLEAGGGGGIASNTLPYTYFIYKSGSNYIAQSGDSTTPGTATSNTDFKTVLQGVIDGISPAGTSTTITLGTGTFVLNTPITIPQSRIGNIHIRGIGMDVTTISVASGFNALGETEAILIGTGTPSYVAGSIGTLTVNANIKNTSVTVSTGDAAKFAVGDYVLLNSNALWSTAATGGAKQGEVHRIHSIAAGVITFESPIYDTYTTANTSTIFKMPMLHNIRVSDCAIVKDSGLTNIDVTFMLIAFVNNAKVDHVKMIDNVSPYYGGITFRTCINSEMCNNHIIQTPSNTYNVQYGMTFQGCCQNCIMTNNRAFGRFRHPFPVASGFSSTNRGYAGQCRGIVIANNVSEGSEIAAFDTHADGEGITFIGNSVLGTFGSDFAGNAPIGFQIRSRKSVLIGNSVNAAKDIGYHVYEDAGDAVMLGNTAINCGDTGLTLDPDAPSACVVVGNYFSNNTNGAVSFGAGAAAVTRMNSNVGFKTEATGTATISSGSTTTVVTHGLGYTPVLADISVTRTNSTTNSIVYWISSPTSTQFTINVNTSPGASTATFAWQIRRG